jgi:hypothetical protein
MSTVASYFDLARAAWIPAVYAWDAPTGEFRRIVEVVGGHLETFCIGQFVIQVLASRVGAIRSYQAPWDHVLYEVWPAPGYGVVWPPTPIDAEKLRFIEARFVTRNVGPDRT